MAIDFVPIPDWFSFDNQGADLAVASLAGDGTQDLVVLMVDNGPQQNRGLLRVGRTLDAEGAVTGGWTPWVDIPDWFSWDNQGAALSVADLTGDGRQDVVILMVNNGPQQNRGLLRVGRTLNADGVVADGWTPWVDIPDWFFWENQGVGLGVTPPDASGRRDLVVFAIDNAAERNRGVYRFGRDFRADGSVTAWTPWIDVGVPGSWFSWENQGAGIAVANLDGAGALDLIVFAIDNPVIQNQQNQGFYRIGRNIGADGTTADWGPWLGVPHWLPWENQYGGIAVARLGGADRLLVGMVDNPPDKNVGYYQVLDLQHDPAVYGRWELLPFLSGVLAVHAAVLPRGRVLFFAGSGSSRDRFDSANFGNEAAGVPLSAVWDPAGTTITFPNTLRFPAGHPAAGHSYDFFCGGHTFLADGRLMNGGGTRTYPFTGLREAAVIDPNTLVWSFVAPMEHGRWYPTLITLGDGRILAATGLSETGVDHNQALDFYSAATNSWTTKHFAGGFPRLPLYAHLFLMRDGRIFFSGGRMDDDLVVQPCIFDPAGDPVPTHEVADLIDPVLRNQSASVLLPPAQDQRVMICGGGPEGKQDLTHAVDTVSIVDLKQAVPQYHEAPRMCLPRLHLNAVLLPDRTVFISGGSLQQESEPLARLEAELYDPASDSWCLLAPAQVARLYHSTAVLLPDGRVLAAGGNPEGGRSVTWVPPDPNEELRLEVYSPPYLFRGPRPTTGTVPEDWDYGNTIGIPTTAAASIGSACLIRPGATTHSFDTSQRLVDLPIVSRTGSVVQVTVPDESNLAPPGWYMVFIVNSAGVPSVAQWIHLS